MTGAARVSLVEVSGLMAPGQPLPFRVFDGSGRLLLAQGQTIQNAQQLKVLLERGACVEYDEVAQARKERAAGAGAGAGLILSTRRQTWFDRFEHQTWALDDLLRGLAKGESVAEGLGEFGDSFIELVDRHPDAALFLAVRQDDRRYALYALLHALNTATVALLSTRQLAWPAPRVRLAVLAALTMNAAIVELQGRMAEQKEPPDKTQMAHIRAHPHRSAEMLRHAGVVDEEWLQGVLDHHERAVGGYPSGLVEPGEMARLLRAADVFTAKISPRALRAPLLPQVAARQLFQDEGGGPIASALIKSVGVYPPGDLVTLKNGETAIVVQRSASGSAPQVAALFNAQGKPIAGVPRRDTSQGATAIAGPLSDRSRIGRILPEVVYGLLM